MDSTKKILVLGAGKSAIYLLEYLRDHAATNQWEVSIADISVNHLSESFASCKLINMSVSEDLVQLDSLVQAHDLIISMIPASMHPLVANACLKASKNLITPSYVSEELKAMGAEVSAKGLLFLNEMGVDPGIDHMSAMEIIHRIKAKGGKLNAFESYCGGLIAPESDNNPWHYKFTWNPRNVILAGQGVANFLQNGSIKYIPYQQLFKRTDSFEIAGYGKFEGYANRDSLKYIESYELHDIETMYRGTFRRPPYCAAWQVFVDLGMTDDTYVIDNSANLSKREFLNLFLADMAGKSVADKFVAFTSFSAEHEIYKMFDFLGFFGDEKIGIASKASPAVLLQAILEPKLALSAHDKDMLVMLHKFTYELAGKEYHLSSSMVVLGEDQLHTAMAKTVGLPIAIAAKLILNGTIKSSGVKIPVEANIFAPILAELKNFGIFFEEVEG